MLKSNIAMLIAGVMACGCATEATHAVPIQPVAVASVPYKGARQQIMVGKFENRSPYGRGVFSDGVDRLGNQAKTILITHLQQTNRFSVLDRDNLDEAAAEAVRAKKAQNIKGADFVLTGAVTEFGRKTTGDQQLFGILGHGKEQTAYAKVSLNVVNVETSEVVYSTQGAGEVSLSNREVIGFGGTSDYDATLNGKVLDFAVKEAVSNLADAIDTGAWRP